jgi:DNA polymerase
MGVSAARAALAWLAEMGADEAIGSEPVNRFAPWQTAERASAVPEPERQAAPSASPPASTAAPVIVQRATGLDAVADARAMAQACSSLADIAAVLSRFDQCPLKRTATNLVYMDGNPRARVLFIGEAPGREEDLQGKPFVGRSGQLLDRMLATIGLSRRAEDPEAAALITNVIFWRPPGNRKPTEAETLMCMPFVLRTIEVLKPSHVVCLGSTPAQRLLGTTDGILKLRGRWRNYRTASHEVPLLPTLHPAYLLRQPAQKRLAWHDFLTLRKSLEGQ